MEYVNDTGLPSVTDFLSPYIDKRWFKPIHRERGSLCHDAMAAHSQCIPFFNSSFNPLYKPYVESGKEWYDKNVKEAILVEKRMEIPGDYCGQPDLVCRLHNDLIALVDWKTAVSEGKYWKFQLAAYQYLVEFNYKIKIDIRLSVRLRKDYGYKALENKYENYDYDLGIFNCAKAVYNELN